MDQYVDGLRLMYNSHKVPWAEIKLVLADYGHVTPVIMIWGLIGCKFTLKKV